MTNGTLTLEGGLNFQKKQLNVGGEINHCNFNNLKLSGEKKFLQASLNKEEYTNHMPIGSKNIY